ncbi:helix-turn-helix transcriptional regulator [Tenacibaculum sp. ZS6-P6]|uniref:helix-turn-helix transcriptional regulator n=1 Tax=Tenacibaculum sp. ZS6-P6 TaxID=3447503 RepID=UPI003F9D871A
MKTDNYIIVASDHSATLSKIVNELNNLHGYSCITVNSAILVTRLLETISPKLMILYFKNNTIEFNRLFRQNIKFEFPILCLMNRYELLPEIPEKTPLLIQPFEILENKYLLTNVKSVLSMVRFNTSIKKNKRKEESSLLENKNLARYVLELDQNKMLFKKIMSRIKELSNATDIGTRNKLNSIVNNIKLNTKTGHWEDFKMYFESINPNFIKQLTTRFPCLTSKDIKYCCYLKMNMSNEDIRYILGINKESVRTHKYRLKKKMTLEREQDLRTYISSI